jgi:hypothetical protein
MTGTEQRKIGSLRDLPRDIAPPRDLWHGIEARIVQEPRGAGADAAGADSKAGPGSNRAGRRAGPGADESGWVRRPWRANTLRILAAAAVIAALAVGIWIGRAVLPVPGNPAATGGRLITSNVPGGDPGAWYAAYMMESKYTQQRAELVKGLEARIAALPPESRAKVVSSLKTLSDSKRDLEAELGKDPSNALLQELLVNTYQDEMRVLTAVHEAGSSGEGI